MWQDHLRYEFSCYRKNVQHMSWQKAVLHIYRHLREINGGLHRQKKQHLSCAAVVTSCNASCLYNCFVHTKNHSSHKNNHDKLFLRCLNLLKTKKINVIHYCVTDFYFLFILNTITFCISCDWIHQSSPQVPIENTAQAMKSHIMKSQTSVHK